MNLTKLNRWLRELIPWLSLRLVAYSIIWFLAGAIGIALGPLVGKAALLLGGWLSSKVVARVEARGR